LTGAADGSYWPEWSLLIVMDTNRMHSEKQSNPKDIVSRFCKGKSVNNLHFK